MSKNTKVLLLVGGGILIFIAMITGIIIGLFHFHVLNIANIVTGGG
jgi:hypothetical protein